MEIEPGERIPKTEERRGEEKCSIEVRNSQEFGLGDTGVQRSKRGKGRTWKSWMNVKHAHLGVSYSW